MIDSILNRERKRIVLDKLVVSNEDQLELVLDEDKIEKETIKHFQNIAGRRKDKPQMSSR